jgi:hypothetical protein
MSIVPPCFLAQVVLADIRSLPPVNEAESGFGVIVFAGHVDDELLDAVLFH